MMTTDYRKKRVDEIIQMLIEISGGNFSLRLQLNENDDEELQALITAVNLTADELSGYVHIDAKPEAVMLFVVDEELTIKSINHGVKKNLRYIETEVQDMPLSQFVTDASKVSLELLKAGLGKENGAGTMSIHFKTKSCFVVATHCSSTPLIQPGTTDRRYAILAIEAIKQITEAPYERPYEMQFDDNGNLISRWDLAKQEASSSEIHESNYEKIQKALTAVLSTMKPEWSLETLAEDIGMEKRTLTKLFRKFHGKSVKEALIEQRMKKAQTLLKDPNIQLKEIAQAIGYKNLSHFSKKFKELYKVSPSEFRQR